AGALREALPKVTKASKVAVVQALGALRDKKAVDPLVKAAADADKGVRLAALRALGDVGDAKGVEPLTKAAAGSPSYERAQAVDAGLALARGLEEAGEPKQARAVYDKLLAAVKDEKTRAVIERLRKGASKS